MDILPLKVIATGTALPESKIDSAQLDQKLGKKSGYVRKRSGIEYRYHADYQASQAQLAANAIIDALHSQQIDADSIDLLIYASAIAVQALPYSAAHVLALTPLKQGIASFDINSSCVSFITALQVAGGLLNSGAYRRIAIVSAELASRGIDWQHEESSLIFGDGAACAIVEKGDGSSGIIACCQQTYTDGLALCEIQAGGTRRNPRAGIDEQHFLFHMQGKALFRLAAELIEDYFALLLQRSGMSLTDIETVIPHQASHLALEHMRKRLKMTNQQLVDIYRYYGNQVSASIPTALHIARINGRFNSHKPTMLIGTAAGLTFAGMVLLP